MEVSEDADEELGWGFWSALVYFRVGHSFFGCEGYILQGEVVEGHRDFLVLLFSFSGYPTQL